MIWAKNLEDLGIASKKALDEIGKNNYSKSNKQEIICYKGVASKYPIGVFLVLFFVHLIFHIKQRMAGIDMSQLDKNIAQNLKRIRKSKNMSLDMLAEKTGVSKSMLGQIERGESNPTVSTIAKIVDGIKVPFEDLIYQKTESVMIIDNDKLPVYKAQDGAYQIRAIFPYDRHRNFEVYEVKIEPGEDCECFVRDDGGCEYIIVVQGMLTLETQEGMYEVASNHAVRLDALKQHSYHNRGIQKLILNIFVSYEALVY